MAPGSVIIASQDPREEDFRLNLHSDPQESECVAAPRGRGRPKVQSDDDRRAALVDEATRVFAELGYGRATMEVVAARAHVSKQTLYRFFPSKPALFAAVIDNHRQSMLALPGDYDDMPLDAALAAIFRTDLDATADDVRMALLNVIAAESIQLPEVMDMVETHGATPARAALSAWIGHEVERGRLSSEEDPGALADILIDMIFGAAACHHARRCGVNDTTEARRTRVLRCIRVFLGGVATR